VRTAIFGDTFDPQIGVANEGQWGHVVAAAAAVHRTQHRSNEAHIVVLRQPAHNNGIFYCRQTYKIKPADVKETRLEMKSRETYR
jgi:hypothetical protein